MNLYEIMSLENEIEHIAEQNEGEIPEELLKELVEKQTESIVQIENLCKFLNHLDNFTDVCKKEENRIKNKRKAAENRIESIKKYLTPYVESQGKIEAGLFKLSTRQSESVNIDESFNDQRFITIVQESKINKNDVKKAIKSGEIIEGARLIKSINLQIK